MYEPYLADNWQAEVEPRPLLFLGTTGTLSLNGGAQAALGLTLYDALVLLFDARLGRLGLRPVAPHDHPASQITLLRNPHAGLAAVALAAGGGWLVRFAIDVERAAGTYPLHHERAADLWYAQLPAGCWELPAGARAWLEEARARVRP